LTEERSPLGAFISSDLKTVTEQSAPAAPSPALRERLVSLDVLRGIIIAFMILVNDSGGDKTYWPLEHAAWNGWTPTDLVFPSFLFMVGVALTFSLPSRLARGTSLGVLVRHIVLRSLGLFAIGEFIYGFPYFDLHTWRIPGVLQRIAVCYLIGSLLYLFTRREDKTASAAPAKTQVRANVPVIATLAVTFLVAYWALLTFVPVPGYGVGRLDPEGNLGASIDRALFSTHLYAQTKTWDPEGLLSTLPAISTILLGILCGEWVRSRRGSTQKTLGMIAAGIVLMAAGQLLHPVFPINKKLWTSTFVLLAGGFTSLAFGICYWLIDVKRWRRWTPAFLVFGTNAILAYTLSEILAEVLDLIGFHGVDAHSWLYQNQFASWLNPYNASLAYAIAYVLLIWLIVLPFYRKRIFLRL
jgi:predicted acyltransferase